ncbi:patatin-like phospholipase family protein [Humitalea sp. 24SJ18S-53]|uniref:patatin-like phospholipase family protein n=1 Tax=Humitalea sp. 24SJ18S-53 TaxID=3422307 RepID=UPI003D670C59
MTVWTRRAALLVALLLPACTIARLPAPPEALTEEIQPLGIPNARFWVDRGSAPLEQELRAAGLREVASLPPDQRRRLPPADYLAISGGGDNGAFGAGLLVGWTASGQRPEFQVVTGVSAGALSAPFAFLGPDYDPALREVFTGVAPPDILLFRRMATALLFGDSLADTGPLYRLIEQHVNDSMMAAIAREYARGRLLLIGTTNLDVQRPVVWNIGAIAASGHPDAIVLMRQIMLASASIPGAFPPVLTSVESAGRRYQEMHVDGGAASQMFLFPASLDLAAGARDAGIERQRTAYLIRNARMDTEWATTSRRFFAISRRALSTTIHFSGVNDVVRIFLTSQRDGVGFRLAYIDPAFEAERPEAFDQAYMKALFDSAYEQARNGYPWMDRPPGFPTPRR